MLGARVAVTLFEIGVCKPVHGRAITEEEGLIDAERLIRSVNLAASLLHLQKSKKKKLN